MVLSANRRARQATGPREGLSTRRADRVLWAPGASGYSWGDGGCGGSLAFGVLASQRLLSSWTPTCLHGPGLQGPGGRLRPEASVSLAEGCGLAWWGALKASSLSLLWDVGVSRGPRIPVASSTCCVLTVFPAFSRQPRRLSRAPGPTAYKTSSIECPNVNAAM